MKYNNLKASNFESVTQINAVADAKINEEVRLWKQFRDSFAQKKTLAEVLKSLKFSKGESVKAKCAQLNFGMVKDPERVSYADNPIAAVNAILGIPGYKIANWNEHEKFFDARIKCDDIRVVYDPTSEGYRFISWNGRDYEMSNLNYQDMWTPEFIRRVREQGWFAELNRKLRNMNAKHNEIDNYLSARRHGTPFAVILSTTESVAHWEAETAAYLEQPYSAYLDHVAEKAEVKQTMRAFQKPNENYHPSVKLAPERVELIKLVQTHDIPFQIGLQSLSAAKPSFDVIENADDVARAILAIERCNPSVKITVSEIVLQ